MQWKATEICLNVGVHGVYKQLTATTGELIQVSVMRGAHSS